MDIFEDEIALDDYIRKGLTSEYKASFNVSVMRDRSRMSEDYNETEQYFKPEEYEAHEKEVESFVGFRNDKPELKELKFIRDTGMNREVALQLDFNMRKRLEVIFPELREFNILCFKAKPNNTARRALVFPQENHYGRFFDTMKKFLSKHDSQDVPLLRSKVKVKFRGKYVLQIEDDTYRNFMDKITATISKYRLVYKLKKLLRRRMIEIESNHEKVKDMRDCMKEIMLFLFPKPCPLTEESKKFDSFGIRSMAADDYISRLNNKYSGRAFGYLDRKSNRFLLRSDPSVREDYIKRLDNWIKQFNNKVKEFEYKLPNRKGFFKNRVKIKEVATKFDTQVKYLPQTKSLQVFFHEYIKEEDRTQPAQMAKIKESQMETLKAQFSSILVQYKGSLDQSQSQYSKTKDRESSFVFTSNLSCL
jgi:hypothetical protein